MPHMEYLAIVATLTRVRDALKVWRKFRDKYHGGIGDFLTPKQRKHIERIEAQISKELRD